ncbi:uncharacterized protein LOC120995001 [Bufo bufo]|uniref:uncharacterized protein LOC120995001 n=1 Tax=Bufo bufo TaxID=8384 RepID=UPI001ABDDD61|nr:uncharacterized protein LOC120995001 [Bufo bufo]XP_040279880.1 uncharacterized protein LOC120995001 [Bufo bufo]
MYSRTTSALFAIIICTSAVWNVKATTTGVTPTEGYSNATASVTTANVPSDTPAETTLSPVLYSSPNSTFSHDNTTAVDSTEMSFLTTPTPMTNSTEAGSITTAPSTLSSSLAVSVTGDVSSTVNKSNNTTTVSPFQEISTQGNTPVTLTFPVEENSTLVSGVKSSGMKYSETVLTSIFSTILVVVLLTILAFCFNKYRKGRSQYSHHPLRENVYESEGYSPPDDTLVISGGLYDAPRIYNPNMTVLEEDESQHDYVSFSGRPGQFRLEFLPGDKDMDPAYTGSLRRNV